MPEEGEGALERTSEDKTIKPGEDWTPAGRTNSDLTVKFQQAVEITSLRMTDKISPFEFQASYLLENKQEYTPYTDGEGKPEVRCSLLYKYKLIYLYQLLVCNL